MWDEAGTLSYAQTDSKFTRRLYVLYALCGIILWGSSRHAKRYKVFIKTASGLAAVFCMADLMLHPNRLYQLIPEVAFSICSFFSLVSLGNVESIVGRSTGLLGRHAHGHGFLASWGKRGMNKLVWIMVVWICKAVASLLQLFILEGSTSLYGICRCFVVMLEAGLHLAIAHSLCQVLTFFELMLDAFSHKAQETEDWGQGVCRWNVVQAMLNNMSLRVDLSFLAQQTASVIVFLSFAAGMLDIFVMNSGEKRLEQYVLVALQIPSLAMALAAFVLFIKAAGVTGTCKRIPPIINSVSVARGSFLNIDRQYLVSYILHSQAGFYVKGSLIDATMLMNYCYLCGAIACGLFTTGLSMSQKN